MIVLALDTAGADCAACLYDAADDRVLATAQETIGRGHAERLMGMIDDVLREAAITIREIGRVAVTIGPGSFTGIRVAVAAARGFALSPGVDAVGVTTLDVLANVHVAENSPAAPFAVAMDAKRGEVYWGEYNPDGTAASAPSILSLDAAKAARAGRLPGFTITGSAATLITGEGGNEGGDRFPIAVVARLGAAMPAGSPRPAPLYLRGPDAKPQEGFALARKPAV